jgi:glucose/arabinose dehydrogenase
MLLKSVLRLVMAAVSLSTFSASAGVWYQGIPGDFASALYATAPPGDAARLFVVSQNGLIHVVTDADGKLDDPFIDLQDETNYDQQELGLLGMAFDPNFATNGYFYVSYTRDQGEQIQSVVSRFRVQGDPLTSNEADPTSEVVRLVVDQPYDNHNGGMIAFGPDGYLYLALGDGGAAYDPENRSQNLETYIGKMLRMDTAGDGPFTAPPDNPFVGDTPGLDLIWHYGLRNPWRFSFDRLTGDLWLADVGQQDYEEVNFVAAGDAGGRNFGWRAYEGNNCNIPAECAPIADQVTFPIYTIAHDGEGKAITGGYRYRGTALPVLQGNYLFGDYIAASLAMLSVTPGDPPTVAARDLTQIFNPVGFKCCLTSFAEDGEGEVYAVTKSKVYKLVDDNIAYLDLQSFGQATEPTMLTGPPGDGSRVVVLQRNGVMRLYIDGVQQETPFADLTDRVASDGELGLLGMAYHPDYATNGYFYLNYQRRTGEGGATIETTISRFTVNGDPPTAVTADPATELVLFTAVQPGGDHNGGSIAFSPNDGYLYIPIGDGGCCNDPYDTAQDLGSPLGKILRIDVDNTDPGLNYAVPADNPFVGDVGVLPEIWAYGLRNPFRSSFDRVTGEFYFGDVGQDANEKVGYQPAASTGGENYGWPIFEGTRCNTDAVTQQDCDNLQASVSFPIRENFRQFGSSVTGGAVYRGSAMPGLVGRYIYADYVSARVLSFVPNNGTATLLREYTGDLDFEDELLSGIVGISEDGVGELYVVSIFGNIYKLVAGLGNESQEFNIPEGEQPLDEAGLAIEIEPARDATLYEEATGALANGTGRNLFAGRTGDNAEFADRRALLYFDVAGELPPDAEVLSASLRMRCTKIPVGGTDTTQSIYRVTRDWNEGPTAATGAGGTGAAAQAGDVTWIHTASPSALWATPGGDFINSARATIPVGDTGLYTWSGTNIALDVIDWLAHPETNFGWMLLGDEATDKSARRYDSREATNPANRPVLVVRYCGSPQEGWVFNPTNGHYYRLTNALTYEDAAAQAECAGGYLATINNPLENQWVLDNLISESGSAYIGYNDREVEGTFAWLNEELALYTNWDTDEPNDSGGEDAVLMLQNTGLWNDVVETTTLVGIIERDTNPIVPPTPHAADQDGDFSISLTELLRVVQLYNSEGFQCAATPEASEDGYLPGAGANESCTPHSSDYVVQDWVIGLSELLRMIQLFNGLSFTKCDEGEDGFCAGA